MLFTQPVLSKDYSRLFSKVDPTVVELSTTQTETTVTSAGVVRTTNLGLGSGVLVSKEGHILTASHVVNDGDQVMVELTDGSMHGARILASIPSADLALIVLKDPPENLKFAKLGDSNKA
jgi:serine protease Do